MSVANTGKETIDDYLLPIAINSLALFNLKYFVAGGISLGTFNSTVSSQQPTLTGHFKAQAYHAIAISLALVDRTLMKSQMPAQYTVKVYNHPLPRQPDTVIKDKVDNLFTLVYCFFVKKNMQIIVFDIVI